MKGSRTMKVRIYLPDTHLALSNLFPHCGNFPSAPDDMNQFWVLCWAAGPLLS